MTDRCIIASPSPSRAPAMADRARRSSSPSGARRRSRRKKSREPEVASMNSTASRRARFRGEDRRERQRANRRQLARHGGKGGILVDVRMERVRRHADERRQRRERHQDNAVDGDADGDRSLVARAECFLNQPWRDDKRRPQKEEQPPAGLRRATGQEIQARGIVCDCVPTAGQRHGHWRDERESDELDRKLHEVDVGRAEEAPRRRNTRG